MRPYGKSDERTGTAAALGVGRQGALCESEQQVQPRVSRSSCPSMMLAKDAPSSPSLPLPFPTPRLPAAAGSTTGGSCETNVSATYYSITNCPRSSPPEPIPCLPAAVKSATSSCGRATPCARCVCWGGGGWGQQREGNTHPCTRCAGLGPASET